MDPVTIATLAYTGYKIGSGIYGAVTESPAERAVRQQLASRQQLIATLTPQAQGQPTAISRASESALRQATQRYMQSYGASARQAGISGTTPARAQQGRIQAASQQALVQQRGQLALGAQQQIGALTAGSLQTQIDLENAEFAAKNTFYQSLGELFGRQTGGTLDPELMELLNEIRDLARGSGQSGLSGGTSPGGLTGQAGASSLLGKSPEQIAGLF